MVVLEVAWNLLTGGFGDRFLSSGAVVSEHTREGWMSVKRRVIASKRIGLALLCGGLWFAAGCVQQDVSPVGSSSFVGDGFVDDGAGEDGFVDDGCQGERCAQEDDDAQPPEANNDPQPPVIEEPEEDFVEPDMCGDSRVSTSVYYGTREPTYLPLTEGQILAIGNFYGCTGTLIAPRWVLSAEHCGLRRGSQICFGADPSNANLCFTAANVYEPNVDMALLELTEDVTTRIPQIEPIPLLTEDMDNSWIGRTVEAAGYGQQETGASNEREFTAEPLVSLRRELMTIDGQGRRGVCFGDSGGPAMVIANDGTVRIAGVLSYGDPSCVGRDNYTRVDLLRDWIEGYTGPTVVDGASCGEVTTTGRCINDQAVWCQDDGLATEACDTCGWDEEARGYRCIDGPDPCQGVDLYGTCDGDVARWCENGTPKTRDCGACGQTCGVVDEIGAVYCEDDPCQGLDYLGRCNGDVAEYCRDNEFRSRNCAAEGLSCSWVNNELGYWCR